LAEFIEYGTTLKKPISKEDCELQFEIWEASDWYDGKGTKIKSWKGKLTTFARIGNLPSDKAAKCGSNGTNGNGRYAPEAKGDGYRTKGKETAEELYNQGRLK
jgi:hypothetical protein